jgi:hypothetical protein
MDVRSGAAFLLSDDSRRLLKKLSKELFHDSFKRLAKNNVKQSHLPDRGGADSSCIIYANCYSPGVCVIDNCCKVKNVKV